MTVFAFAPASREQAKARIGLQGPAGSGKTMTALKLAERLANGGQIGLVDTERGSALTYAPVPGRPDLGGIEFLHLPLDNYDPRNLIKAVHAATAAALPVLIVDSWSHFWNGKGGLLSIVEEAGRKPGAGGSFGGWREGTPIEQDMLEALLNYPGHVICTMRMKGDYSIEGKKVTKLGVKAVQREGAEYELGLIIDMLEGTGTVTKTRYRPLENLTFHHPGAELAEVILEQLGQGVDPVQQILEELTADGLTYQAALDLHGRAVNRSLLGHNLLHPVTAAPTKLGDLIREYGEAAKPKAAPAPAARPEPAPEGPEPRVRDFLHEAHEAPDAKTVRRIYDEAAAFGSYPDYLAQIEKVGRAKEQAEQQAAPAPTADEPATPPQMRKIHAALGEVGITDRGERHRVLSALVGRAIASANELTKTDAGTVIDALDAAAQQPDPAVFLRALADGVAQAEHQAA